MRSSGVWACVALLCLGAAASCGSSEEKQAVAAGGDDQGGVGGDEGASGGRAGGAGKGGSAGTAGAAGALGIGGGDAGGGGVASGGAAGGSAAGEGNASGLGGAAGQGGSEPLGGNGGAGGAACCSTSAYQSSSQLLPSVVCSGWELVNSANTELPELLGGYLRLSTSTVAENQYYMVPAENLKTPTKLVLEARMQLISGSAPVAYRAPANLGFVLSNQKNLLMIGSGEIFILSAENTKGASAAVATTDAMHVYRMEVDVALGNVEVFYDGVSKLTGKTFAPDSPVNFLYFGDGSIYGTGVSDWAYFTHNADACAD